MPVKLLMLRVVRNLLSRITVQSGHLALYKKGNIPEAASTNPSAIQINRWHLANWYVILSKIDLYWWISDLLISMVNVQNGLSLVKLKVFKIYGLAQMVERYSPILVHSIRILCIVACTIRDDIRDDIL